MKPVLTALWVVFLFSLPLWVSSPYLQHILVISGIFTIAAMSLNLLLGYAGQLSLGHVAFFGIGAYASALVSLGFSVHVAPDTVLSLEPKPVWLAIPVGMAFAAASGWFIGRISFKVRGAYFVIVSISFAEVTRLVAVNWVELTQGPMALNNIPPLTLWLPALGEHTFWKKPENYWLVVTVAVVCYVIVRRLVHSRAGRAMIALKENEPLATSVVLDTPAEGTMRIVSIVTEAPLHVSDVEGRRGAELERDRLERDLHGVVTELHVHVRGAR